MPYHGEVIFKYTAESPVVTLRQAARTYEDSIKCNCTGCCAKSRCSCRQKGFKCSSHCHPKNYSCLNKDESDKHLSKSSDSECTITMVDCSNTVTSLLKRRKKQMEIKTKYRKVVHDISLEEVEKKLSVRVAGFRIPTYKLRVLCWRSSLLLLLGYKTLYLAKLYRLIFVKNHLFKYWMYRVITGALLLEVQILLWT